MADNKKSFVLYADLISVVKKLVEADRINKTNYAGELFLIILEYVNDLNPIPVDFITELAFEPIKLQLKRDLVKWSEFREKQSVNGARGGRPKKDLVNIENPKNPSLNLESQKSLNVNVSVNDNVNANESVSVIANNYTPAPVLGIDYIKAYNDLPDEFKNMYDEEFYKSWLNINSFISQHCQYLRKWSDQLTIIQFKNIFDRIVKKQIEIKQVQQAFLDLDGNRMAKEKYNSVYHGFNAYLKTIQKSA